MNPFYQEVVLSLLRKALTGVAASLVTYGWLTVDQTNTIILGIAGIVASVIWSYYQRYRDQVEKIAGLQLPKNSTLQDMKNLAADKSQSQPVTLSLDATPPLAMKPPSL